MSYETILTIHIISAVCNIGLVVIADCIGLLWVWGKIKELPGKLMVSVHRLVWVGVVTSVGTGLYMFWEVRDYLLTVPAFYTKMFFLLALIINSFFITRHLITALRVGPFSYLNKGKVNSFFLNGAISAISWVAVVISAFNLSL